MTIEDWNRAIGREGSTYELLDGRLCVHPFPEAPHEALQHWLQHAIINYEDVNSAIIQRLTVRAKEYVSNRLGPTIFTPDLAVYLDPGTDRSARHRSWADISPTIVGEVLEPPNINSKLDLKVEIYLQVPSIREYWIVDRRLDWDRPKLTVYRKRGKRWQIPIEVPFGGTYETKLLPGFKLIVDPRS